MIKIRSVLKSLDESTAGRATIFAEMSLLIWYMNGNFLFEEICSWPQERSASKNCSVNQFEI
jgi:hypothetical protein